MASCIGLIVSGETRPVVLISSIARVVISGLSSRVFLILVRVSFTKFSVETG